MAFVLVIAGLLMIVTGSKGTYAAFGSQLASDFTGSQPFTYWVAAIGAVGALGYVQTLRSVSRLFLALILIAMVLANKGFFAQLQAALKSGPVAPAQGTGLPTSNQSSSSGSSASAGVGGADGSTLKQSLTKPGGGGFWDYFGIPNSFRPSWAQSS